MIQQQTDQMTKLPTLKSDSISLSSNSSSSPPFHHTQSPNIPSYTKVNISNKIHPIDQCAQLQITLQREQEQSQRVKNLLLEKIVRLEHRERMAQDEARKLNSLLQQLVTSNSFDEEQVSQLKQAVAEKQKAIDVLQDEVENQRKLRYQVSDERKKEPLYSLKRHIFCPTIVT